MNQPGDKSQPATGQTIVTTLLLTDLVDSTKLVEQLGDTRAAEIFAQTDRAARDLLKQHSGKEIDKTDGFLLLFNRPIDAVLYALSYHESLGTLSRDTNINLAARAGIHLGEVILQRNSPDDVSRGAKPIEVEGIAKPLAARIMSLAQGGQTLITQAAFDLARRGVVGSDSAPADTAWMAHGPYMLKGVDEPVEIFEAGVQGVAPLSAPSDTEKAKRSVAAGDEETLGWRPAAGLDIPHRTGWILERKIGEGGFGEVWLALHKRTKNRRVFKFCFDADRLRSLKRELTLFRLLRDALGDRKDIARLYEVQLEEPPFFLESEFTPSGSLIDWAESQGGINKVSLQTRLDFVAQTSRAVAAAHSVGILHKDIKPGNILVYEDESGQPRPRLADFGIGTLTEEGKHEGRNITMAGFTPATLSDEPTRSTTQMYAPPEILAGKPFTALGDIYAVGVFMYQMVVGDLDRPLAQGWERDVPDSCLRDDIAVCVEGNEDQRMGSAQGLAKRLETLPLRRRNLRRHKLTRFGAIASAILVVVLAITAGLFLREQDLRRRAETAEQRTKVVKEFILQRMIRYGDPSARRPGFPAGTDVTVAEVLELVLADALTSFKNEPEIRAEVLQTLGVALKEIGSYDKAELATREALNIRQNVFDDESALVAESLFALANVLWFKRDYESALPLYEKSLAMRRHLFNEISPEVAEGLNNQGLCLNNMGRLVEAESLILKGLNIRRTLLAEHNGSIEPMIVAASENNLGLCLSKQKDYQGAIKRFQTALEMARKYLGQEHVYVARTLHNIAGCLIGLENYAEAEHYYRDALKMKVEVLGEDHLSTNTTRGHLGQCLVTLKQYDEAEKLLTQSYESLKRRLDDQHDRIQKALERLIELYKAWGKPEQVKIYQALQQETAGSP